MNEHRAKRYWHIEQRFGYFYATNQYGGFSRRDTRADAAAAIDTDIVEYGDEWAQPTIDLNPSMVEGWRR